MNEKSEDQHELSRWEEQINALLDGELGAQQAQELQAAARDDRQLAAAIVAAYQLQQALEAVPQQRAPDSLRLKLANIPHEHGKPEKRGEKAARGWLQPAWITALAAVPLLLIALSLRGPEQSHVKEPSIAELEQARQELAVAFGYLEKVTRKASLEIGTTVNSEMQQSINENMIRTISDQMEFNKERNT